MPSSNICKNCEVQFTTTGCQLVHRTVVYIIWPWFQASFACTHDKLNDGKVKKGPRFYTPQDLMQYFDQFKCMHVGKVWDKLRLVEC